MRKERLQQVVDTLPQNVDVDALIEKLHFLDKLEAAEKQIDSGDVLEHAEARRRLDKWLGC